MVEHRRFGNLLPHLILLTGVAIVAFPVYLAIIASTHDNAVIANGQMPLYPGTHGLETYWNTIVSGTGSTTRQPVGSMMLNSLIMALGIAFGKIAISIISAYAIVFFCVSVPDDGVLDHLHHADAAGRGAHLPDLQDHQRSAHAGFLFRPDPAADRVGNRDIAVPAVLHDRARRSWSRPPRSTAPGRSASSSIRCCRCRSPTSRRCS